MKEESMYSLNQILEIECLNNKKVGLFSENERYLLSKPIFISIVENLAINSLTKKELLANILKLGYEVTEFETCFQELQRSKIISPVPSDNNKANQSLRDLFNIENEEFDFALKTLSISIISFLDTSITGAFISNLHNSGVDVVEKGALGIVLTNDYLDSKLKGAALQFEKAQLPWMIIKPTGTILCIGPIFNTNSKFSHVNLDFLSHRLKENNFSKTDLMGYSSEKNALKNQIHIPSNLQVAFNIAINEIIKLNFFLGSKLEDNILTYNTNTLCFDFHNFSPDLEGVFSGLTQTSRTDLQPSRKKYFEIGGERSCSPEETYERIKTFESPITGIISKSYYKYEGGYHIFYGPRAFRALGDSQICDYPRPPEIVVGKGKSKTEAKVGFIAEAIERYFSNDHNLHEKHVYPFEDISDLAISPYTLLNFSTKQYSERKILNENSSPFHWVPFPFDETRPINWVPAYSLLTSAKKYVPASFCFMEHTLIEEAIMCPADSNGCASGNTIEEAIFYGILELIERDAMGIWWYNRLTRSTVDLASFRSPAINEAQEQIKKLDRELRVIDISTDIHIPSFAAVSWDKKRERIVLGSGAHLNAQTGIMRAIAEHNQILTRASVSKEINLSRITPSERDLVRWLIQEKIDSHPFISIEPAKRKFKEDYQLSSTDNFLSDIQICVDKLKKAELEAFWLPLTPLNFPLSSVKVIIPQLRHFWRRLGPGRLYEVPLRLGDFSSPLKEEELNPISYFV